MKALMSLFLVLFLFVSCEEATLPEEEFLNYLTFQSQDTARNITVNIVASDSYDKLGLTLKLEDKTQVNVQLKPQPVIMLKGISVFRYEFKNLIPENVYSYSINYDGLVSKDYKFKMLPSENKPVRFINGGDTDVDPEFEALVKVAATHDPAFALIGGDIAYANGDPDNWPKWQKWLSIWRDNAVTSQGFQIPLMIAIGNHETNKLFFLKKLQAPFYFSLFPQAGDKTYFIRTVAKDNAFVILDTGHVYGFSKQARWMKKNKELLMSHKRRIAAYHIPMFPAHRPMRTGGSVKGRRSWQPLFEEMNFTTGLEHHDHVLKRTHPMKGEKVAEGGIIYLGDGAMGKTVRTIEPKFYLDQASSVNHFWLVDMDSEKMVFKAIGFDNEVFDTVTFK